MLRDTVPDVVHCTNHSSEVKPVMTPSQMRMARAALQMTVREVEKRTGVNKNTVSRYEAGREILASALQKMEQLFRDEGVIFLEADGTGGQGVRLPLDARKGQAKPNLAKRSQKT
jgi:transcriptional regulator with XRE-family HTH domain